MRQRAECVLHVESVVRHGKGKSGVAHSLIEIDVLAEGKGLQIRKFVEAERRPEVDSLVRIGAAIIGIRIPSAIEIETELQGVLADHVIETVGQGILPFEDFSDRERCVSKNESGGTIQNHRRSVPSQTGWCCEFVILRSAGVEFVQQRGGECVGPSHGGLEGTDIGVGQGLRAIVADRRVKDDASGRIEVVEIEGEKQAIPLRGLIIQPGRDHPIVALSGFDSEIGVQRVDGVRDLLEIHLVILIAGELGLGIEVGTGKSPLGAGRAGACVNVFGGKKLASTKAPKLEGSVCKAGLMTAIGLFCSCCS